MYPHSAIPLIPTQSPYNTKSFPPTPDRIRTARHTPLSAPSPDSYPPYLPYIHPSHPTTPEPNLLQRTRPDSRPYPQPSVHYQTPIHTLPPPNQTHSHTSTKPIYPTIPSSHIIVPSKPSPLLLLYTHPDAKTLISPSNVIKEILLCFLKCLSLLGLRSECTVA